MNQSDEKFCVDCMHCRKRYDVPLCVNTVRRDPATGDGLFTPCWIMRQHSVCGPKAKLYEPKPIKRKRRLPVFEFLLGLLIASWMWAIYFFMTSR